MTKEGERARFQAQVTWEECGRPTEPVYFDLSKESAQLVIPNADAFLVGLILPAFHYGERRIHIEEEVCPQLCENLEVVQYWLRLWHYTAEHPLVSIEAPRRKTPLPNNPDRQAGFFFSGGIDSYATLFANRKAMPSGHSGYIRSGILIYGLEMDDPAAFGYVERYLREVAAELDI